MTYDLERPQADVPHRPPGIDAREGAIFTGLVLLSRLALLVVLGRLVRGQEFTDDVDMLLELARGPLDLLLGETARHGQHPPLLGMLEAVFVLPLQRLVSDFYALRLTFIFYETLTAWFFWRTLLVVTPETRLRRWILAVFLVVPMGWMTSTVMAQDEVMSACFLSAVLWLAVSRRDRAALILCGLGVVAGKIFLLVPLAALILVLPTGRIWARAIIGFAPIALVYAVVLLATRLRGTPPPLAGFTPTAEFGVNLWVVLSSSLQVSAEQARRWSGILALLGGLAPAVLVWFQSGEGEARSRLEPALGDGVLGPDAARRLAALLAAMLLWVFALFYHVNPEYFVLVMPVLLLATSRGRSLVASLILLTVPWAINFFFGVRNAVAAGTSGGKGVFVRIYQAVFPIAPEVMYQVSLWVCIVATFWVAVAVSRDAVGRSRAGAP